MAVMFPERRPAAVDSDAERRLFGEFRQTFSDGFTVFAQVAWLSKQRGTGARDERRSRFASPWSDRGALQRAPSDQVRVP